MQRRVLLLLGVLALALVSASAAQAAGEPWEGGLEVRSPVEQKLFDIGLEWIGEQTDPPIEFEYICVSPEEWASLPSPEGDYEVWGFVAVEVAPHAAWLSPQACTGVQHVMDGRNGSKMCQSGERPVMETQTRKKTYWQWVKKRKLVTQNKKRVWKTVRLRVKREKMVYVQVQTGIEPLYEAQCEDWLDVLFGVQVVAHETLHMWGELDEAKAECYGLQNVALWVSRLSGDDEFAGEAAKDYAADYAATRITDPVYGSAECRYQGALDLSPEDEWP